MIRILLLIFVLAALAATGASADERHRQTVIYEGAATAVASAENAAGDLWVTLPDLTRATKFEVKPEGVCATKLCIPIPPGRKDEFISERAGTTWFNLSAFARHLKQPAARDEKNNLWFFGPRPENQNSHLASLTAPDFTLPDVSGKAHSLSDFRGKKVLLITWASW